MSEYLDLNKALELLAGEKDLLIELMESFVIDKKLTMEGLKQAESMSQEEGAKFVHYFKGAARQLGGKKMAQSGQELEDYFRGRTTPENQGKSVQQMEEQFYADYVQTLSEIQDALDIL